MGSSPTKHPWREFTTGEWTHSINVRSFIQANYQPYLDGSQFLSSASSRTAMVLEEQLRLLREEKEAGGVLDIDTSTVSGINSFGPGYIQKENETIVGLQTDAPLKRMVNPYGGLRMAKAACEAYGLELSPQILGTFSKHRKTHNDGVFGVYTDKMRLVRRNGLITGLPDAYGRGRIIGDYRRVSLYGVDALVEEKREDLARAASGMSEEVIRSKEEIGDQIDALLALVEMGESYGFDLRRPAVTAKEAVQWLYLAYLGATKEQNGAAMSLGRNSCFIDIYVERDIQEGTLDETGAQELIDQLFLKLRLIRHLRTPEYNQLFAGDPTWVTEAIGGIGSDGRPMVTKTSFRMLNTLRNLGSAPEPNLTVLWAEGLPQGFKRFCTELSIDTSALQYENDDLMRPLFGDDYSIACCVSAMRTGEQMQYFGARMNLAKALLLSLNQGRDEITGDRLVDGIGPVCDTPLRYHEVVRAFQSVINKSVSLYADMMNCIHYMHDKYHYENLQMALHDSDPERLMAFGVAGFSVVVDSLCAIRYGKVKTVRDGRGIASSFESSSDTPCYGNGDERADSIALEVLSWFGEALSRQSLYRNAQPTLSILTITSNVVYGKATGATPDGRKGGEPFAPGANPLHGREREGAIASMASVASLPYEQCLDGISYTLSLTPSTLGQTEEERVDTLTHLVDGYMANGGHHINANVVRPEVLRDAMEHAEKYPNLTIRVSGYAVSFTKLTREQQEEILRRCIHGNL